MAQSTKDQDRYLAAFEQREKSGVLKEPSWVHDLRRSAISSFATLGFPTTREEEWKYTNVAPLVKTAFMLTPPPRDSIAVDRSGNIIMSDFSPVRLTFVDGHYLPNLSGVPSLPEEVQAGNLAAILQTHPESLEPYLARYADYQGRAFVALNTAFFADGAFVYIPPGVTLETPVYLLFIATGGREPTQAHPRNLIVFGSHSQATIVERYVALTDDCYFTNAVTELVVGAHAVVDHVRLQGESRQAFHVGALHIHQDWNSNVASHAIAFGSVLGRHDIRFVLDGEGSECTLNGLYMVNGRQHVDHHTRIDHVKAHCTSRELYKGVLNGHSRGVFNGKIVVHKAAEKTDALQINKNLLLSDDALIDSMPQLEIFNNDVRCSHGSTTGKLDDDALFYLRSRGLDEKAARSLLTYAFVSEILNRLTLQSLRDQLEERLLARLHTVVDERGVS